MAGGCGFAVPRVLNNGSATRRLQSRDCSTKVVLLAACRIRGGRAGDIAMDLGTSMPPESTRDHLYGSRTLTALLEHVVEHIPLEGEPLAHGQLGAEGERRGLVSAARQLRYSDSSTAGSIV